MEEGKGEKGENGGKVNRAGRLPPAEDSRVPGKAVHHGRRHGDACQDSQRAEDENDGEISNLLQWVVTIKPVRLRGQMKGRIVHERVPALLQNARRSRYDACPLLRSEHPRAEATPRPN